MALALFTDAHRKNCKCDHKHNSRTSEYDERKKGSARCEYPIFVRNALGYSSGKITRSRWEQRSNRPEHRERQN